VSQAFRGLLGPEAGEALLVAADLVEVDVVEPASSNAFTFSTYWFTSGPHTTYSATSSSVTISAACMKCAGRASSWLRSPLIAEFGHTRCAVLRAS
jgi:hypothetical protein